MSTRAVDSTSAGSTTSRARAARSATSSSCVSPPGDSRTALSVPGAAMIAARTARPTSSSRAGSAPTIRIATGVRAPVAIMSVRARAGAVQALVQPGRRVARSSISTSSPVVGGVSSGHRRESARRTGRGAQPLYHRVRARLGHCARGSSRTVVSAIENGAGSVAVSARPTLPNTVATSLKAAMARSCLRSARSACSGDRPGSVVGMNRRSPSSMRGEELAAEAREDGQAREDRQQRGHQGHGRPRQREMHERPVAAHQRRVTGLSSSGFTRPRRRRRAAPGPASTPPAPRPRRSTSWSRPAGPAAGRSRR